MYKLKLYSMLTQRFLFTQQILNKSHYDCLGITPKATQNDIKAAYYKLSMLYHPDKNKGSPEAADKFRDISSAYEVLGNYKLRRLYDKGIIHTAGDHDIRKSNVQTEEEEIHEDDPQTKFYKQHMRKSRAPPVSGRTPIYDFDEWSKNHYGTAFNRNQEAKRRYNEKVEKERTDSINIQKEYLIFGLTLLVTIILIGFYREIRMEIYEKPETIKHNDRD